VAVVEESASLAQLMNAMNEFVSHLANVAETTDFIKQLPANMTGIFSMNGFLSLTSAGTLSANSSLLFLCRTYWSYYFYRQDFSVNCSLKSKSHYENIQRYRSSLLVLERLQEFWVHYALEQEKLGIDLKVKINQVDKDINQLLSSLDRIAPVFHFFRTKLSAYSNLTLAQASELLILNGEEARCATKTFTDLIDQLLLSYVNVDANSSYGN
jgi:hypothetical protein